MSSLNVVTPSRARKPWLLYVRQHGFIHRLHTKVVHTQQCSSLDKVLECPSTSALGTRVLYRPVMNDIDQSLILLPTLRSVLPLLGQGCYCKSDFQGDHLWRHSKGTWDYRQQRVCDLGCKDMWLQSLQDNLRIRCQLLGTLLREHRVSERLPSRRGPFPRVEQRMGKHDSGRQASWL